LSLNELKPGETGIIQKIEATSGLKKRLLKMGFVPGEKVSMVEYAPLGDPIKFVIKGYHVSLRQEEAQNIIINLHV
jgi:Fe2+ transport system protein FeoA